MINEAHIDILNQYAILRGWMEDVGDIFPLFFIRDEKLYVSRQQIKDYEEKRHRIGNRSKVYITNEMLTRQMDAYIVEHIEFILQTYKRDLKDVVICIFNQKLSGINVVNTFKFFSSDKEQDKIHT